jgi:dienelactone hydrolase
MLRFALITGLLLALPVLVAGQAGPEKLTVRQKMEKVMGPLPGDERKVPLDVKVVAEEKLEGYTRKKVTFAVEKGDRVPAWLLVPDGASAQKKAPAMLCLHQTIDIGKDEPVGLGGRPSLHYALDLVKRGYVCLAPDYPSFGEYKYDFNGAFYRKEYLSGSMKAIWNNMQSVDYLQTLPEVDGERIGVIGHSLGGHNAMFTGALEPRLKVIVSCCGFTSFKKYYGGNLSGWSSPRYMPRLLDVGFEVKAANMPFEFVDVVESFSPRGFMAVSPVKDDNFDVTGVKDVMAQAEVVYKAAGKSENLRAVYPESGHDFPADGKKAAYEFIDDMLKKGVRSGV